MTDLYNVFASNTIKTNRITVSVKSHTCVNKRKAEKIQRFNRTGAKKAQQINKSEHLSQCRMSETMMVDDSRQEKENPPRGTTLGGPKTELPGRGTHEFNLIEWSSQVFSPNNEIVITTKALLMALGVSMNEQGICRITYDEIRRKSGIKSDSTISKHLKIAIEKGWISRIHDDDPEGEHWLVYRAEKT